MATIKSKAVHKTKREMNKNKAIIKFIVIGLLTVLGMLILLFLLFMLLNLTLQLIEFFRTLYNEILFM